MYAALLGLVFVTSAAALWKRGLGAPRIVCRRRGDLPQSGPRLARRPGDHARDLRRACCCSSSASSAPSSSAAVAGGLVVATFTFAIMLGGESIAERTFTLFAQDPVSLYSASRGGQLVYAFDDLVNSYPLGAGLGRWGMINGYFGGGARAGALGRDSGCRMGHRRRHSARARQRRGAGRGARWPRGGSRFPIRTRRCARALASCWRRTSAPRRSSSASRRL